jgi:hypothetical protein
MPTREDVLIGRVVDGEAHDADWADLDRLARADAGIWKRVAHAQRAHARLERAVEDAIAVAELVDAPIYRPGRGFWGSVRSSAGWAVAAVLAVAFVGPFKDYIPGGAGLSGLPAQHAGIGYTPLHSANPEEAFNRYINAGLANGRVVGEMDPVLLEAREVPGASGATVQEVFVLRRVVERISGENLPVYTVRFDEHGLPSPRPMEFPKPAAPAPGTAQGIGL